MSHINADPLHHETAPPSRTPEQILADHRVMNPLSPQPKVYARKTSKAAKRDRERLTWGYPIRATLRKLQRVARAHGFLFFAVGDEDGKRVADLVMNTAHLQYMDEGLTWEVHPSLPYRAVLAVKDGHVAAIAVARKGGVVECYRWEEPIPEDEHGLTAHDNAWAVFALWAAKSARSMRVQEHLLRVLAQDLGIEASSLAFSIEVTAHNEALVKAMSPEVLTLRA